MGEGPDEWPTEVGSTFAVDWAGPGGSARGGRATVARPDRPEPLGEGARGVGLRLWKGTRLDRDGRQRPGRACHGGLAASAGAFGGEGARGVGLRLWKGTRVDRDGRQRLGRACHGGPAASAGGFAGGGR